MTTATTTRTDFGFIHHEAHQAGMAAASAAMPKPMTVVECDVVTGQPNGQSWVIPDGPCGFAGIKFAGNTAWGRWTKANGIAKPCYGGGFEIWVRAYGQSVTLKSAYAQAYAQTLRAHGIEAHAWDRLD